MEKKAIILVGHGSSMPHNKEVISALAKKLKENSFWDEVSYSFMNMSLPSIKDAIEDVCADPMVTSIVMAPVFIAPGVHIKEDVPEILGLAPGEKTKEMEINGKTRTFYYSEPFGPDDRLVDIINDRALETVDQCIEKG